MDATYLHVTMVQRGFGNHRDEDDSEPVWEVGTVLLLNQQQFLYITFGPCDSASLSLSEVLEEIDFSYVQHFSKNINIGKIDKNCVLHVKRLTVLKCVLPGITCAAALNN